MSILYLNGDVFLTRNEKDNQSPGYWNHTAIYYNDKVIEAQDTPYNKVILSDWEEFYNRYPEIIRLRYKDEELANEAAKTARKSVGLTYRRIASLFVFLRKSKRGENCVSVVRKAWKKVLNKDMLWHIPDDIYNRHDGFELEKIK